MMLAIDMCASEAFRTLRAHLGPAGASTTLIQLKQRSPPVRDRGSRETTGVERVARVRRMIPVAKRQAAHPHGRWETRHPRAGGTAGLGPDRWHPGADLCRPSMSPPRRSNSPTRAAGRQNQTGRRSVSPASGPEAGLAERRAATTSAVASIRRRTFPDVPSATCSLKTLHMQGFFASQAVASPAWSPTLLSGVRRPLRARSAAPIMGSWLSMSITGCSEAANTKPLTHC
jgi:hypothetical protein